MPRRRRAARRRRLGANSHTGATRSPQGTGRARSISIEGTRRNKGNKCAAAAVCPPALLRVRRGAPVCVCVWSAQVALAPPPTTSWIIGSGKCLIGRSLGSQRVIPASAHLTRCDAGARTTCRQPPPPHKPTRRRRLCAIACSFKFYEFVCFSTPAKFPLLFAGQTRQMITICSARRSNSGNVNWPRAHRIVRIDCNAGRLNWRAALAGRGDFCFLQQLPARDCLAAAAAEAHTCDTL